MKGLETRESSSAVRVEPNLEPNPDAADVGSSNKLNATAALVDYHCEEGGGGVPARVSRSHTAPTGHAPLPLSL